MRSPKVAYLFIFEDGTLRQSMEPPTAVGLKCIGDGVLQVVTSVGAKFVEYDRDTAGRGDVKLLDIPEASQSEDSTIPDGE